VRRLLTVTGRPPRFASDDSAFAATVDRRFRLKLVGRSSRVDIDPSPVVRAVTAGLALRHDPFKFVCAHGVEQSLGVFVRGPYDGTLDTGHADVPFAR
jgi:hypothetical protein